MTSVVDERRRARQADALREDFRRRWIATGIDPAAAVEPELDLLARLLDERIGEAVGDVEDGRPDLLAGALGEALAIIDQMDDRLGHTEVWVRQLALRQGVVVGMAAARDAAAARRRGGAAAGEGMRGFLADDDRARRSDLVDLALYLHHETEKAWLLSDSGDPARAEWLAKSQADGAGGIWTMPEWVARKRGWM